MKVIEVIRVVQQFMQMTQVKKIMVLQNENDFNERMLTLTHLNCI